MENLLDIAEFESARFRPLLPDERQVNPQRYGAELAFWLVSELARHGVVTSYPGSEDWGWYVDYEADSGARFAVHCGNIDESETQWFLQLRRFGRKSFGRDKPPFAEAAPLVDALQQVLREESSISNLDWRYPESPDADD